MQDWEGVSEFAAVARTLSFTQAAARLGISTAQVSRRIGALEARLGVKLLQRTTRKVSMTEQGETYHTHIRRVLDGLTEAERHEGWLILAAPTRFHATYVETHLMSRLMGAIRRVDPTVAGVRLEG